MFIEQQNYLKKMLYADKRIKDINDDDPFVGIWFNDLVEVIDRLNKANKQ